MKCPECGQWNRASMPHCIKCGAPLNIDEVSRLQWKDTLKDSSPSTAYLRADEFGQVDASPDSRDKLAGEMQDLKKRKREGAERQSRLSRQSPSHTAPEVIVTEETTSRTRKVTHDNMPLTAVRIQPTVRDESLRREESENRHRVRFMNENGVFAESRTYDPIPVGGYTQGTGSWHLAGPLGSIVQPKEKKHIFLKLLLGLAILAVIGAAGWFGYQYLSAGNEPAINHDAIISASFDEDGLPAHTILIPGEEGTTIYIKELHASYVVTNGFATIQVVDHTWYDNLEGALDETMDVTLTPFLKTSAGRQSPLPLVTYQITIPLSPISLEYPDSLRTTVSTTVSAIRLRVRPGSRVFVNDKDESDKVNNETGEMNYNAKVQPIGDNVYNFTVRSRYCREQTLSVVLYREKQDLVLDLAPGTIGSTNEDHMKVSAQTEPGAYVTVSTPYSEINTSEIDKTGKFYFYAVFDKIGYNTITINATLNGKSVTVNHEVYYLPIEDIYSRKAWGLSPDGYSELLNNMPARIKKGQIYEVKGTVHHEESTKPQRVVIYTSEDGKSQPVVVEIPRAMNRHLEIGQYYRIFADVTATYNSMPVLTARYVHEK